MLEAESPAPSASVGFSVFEPAVGFGIARNIAGHSMRPRAGFGEPNPLFYLVKCAPAGRAIPSSTLVTSAALASIPSSLLP
jgi:hypothetical protein